MKTKRALVTLALICSWAGLNFVNTKPTYAFKTDETGHPKITELALLEFSATTATSSRTYKFTEKARKQIAWANDLVDYSSLFGLVPYTGHKHFDDELFVEGFQRVVNLRNEAIKALLEPNPGGKAAREAIGAALHTIQDFYAHSNWIDLKTLGRAPQIKWGIEGSAPVTANPSRDTKVCANLRPWEKSDSYSTTLTSGYYPWNYVIDAVWLAGKCAHGQGLLEAIIAYPVRGIAKDGGGEGYPEAFNEAKTASLEFIESIRNEASIRDNDKALRALTGYTPPLIFVIDNSGSMSNEINVVKAEVASIVNKALDKDYPPQEFILVEFNDPTVGPISITSDPQEFLRIINAIQLGDGGDCPELYYEAMLTAIESSPAGSEIYSFTDASAKDDYLSGQAIAAATDKEIVGTIAKTGACLAEAATEMAEFDAGMNKQEHAPTQLDLMSDPSAGFVDYGAALATQSSGDAALLPAVASAANDSFARLARETGGAFFSVSPSDISKVFDVIRTRVLSDTTPMLIRAGNLTSTPVEVAIPVDGSVALANIVFTVEGSLSTFTLKNPSGATVTASPPNIIFQNLGTNRIYTLYAPTAGVWKLQFGGSGPYSLKVSAASAIQFDNFEFVEPVELPHADQLKIPGQPVTGAAYQARARVFGDAPSPTFQLVGDDGSVLQTLALAPVALSGTFSGTLIPPAQPFRVQVSGLNAANQQYQRLFPTLYNVKSVGVRLDMASYIKMLATAKVLSGQTIPMNFVVENLGPAGTFSVTATASDAQILAVRPPSLTLASGLSQTVVVTVGIPPTRVDKDIAVSVVAANVADSSVYNTSVVNLFVPGANLMQIPMVSKPAEPVPFSWLEATTGGRVVAAGDDTYERVDLPFPFTYFGQSYSQIFVASNGFITFGAGANSRYPVCAPSRNWPNNAVYAFWSDLIPTGGANGNVYVRQVDPQTVVVQWNRVKHYFRQTLQTFQIILRADSSITLQYKSVDPSAQGVVGFEDSLGLTGGSIVCPGRNASPANNSAYRFAVR